MRQFEGYQRGVNLGGWFSQCDHRQETYDHFITEADFDEIRAWGLDHVRLPVDYELLETKDGQHLEEGFERLQRVVDWCGSRGLNLVLDLHKAYGFSFDKGEQEHGFFQDEALQERFYRLWEAIARRFGRYPERVAFELLNEVTDRAYCEPWNRIAAACIARIRPIAPETWILVGGYYNNSVVALKDLLPPPDGRIVYNFHCYDPIIFTHQGAPWVDGMDTSFRIGLSQPCAELAAATERLLPRAADGLRAQPADQPLSSAYFEASFAEAVRVAEERNVPLYCGEYGVIDRADPADTVQWYRLIHTAFTKAGIAHAAWSWRAMDFGLSDPRLEGVRPELIPLL